MVDYSRCEIEVDKKVTNRRFDLIRRNLITFDWNESIAEQQIN